MPIFFRLFLLFTCIPLVELYLLIRIGQMIGAFHTILLVLLTGMAGAWLARREGTRTLDRIQGLLSRGEMPGEELLDALLIFMAGLVLITPGILTDLLGLFLLVPRGRAFVRKKLGDYFQRRVNAQNVTIVYRNPNGSG